MEKKGSSEAGLAKIQPFVSEASGKRFKRSRLDQKLTTDGGQKLHAFSISIKF
jgi:hypothetical protein